MVVFGPSHRAYDCSRSPCAAGFPFHKVSSSHLADHHFFLGRVVDTAAVLGSIKVPPVVAKCDLLRPIK